MKENISMNLRLVDNFVQKPFCLDNRMIFELNLQYLLIVTCNSFMGKL